MTPEMNANLRKLHECVKKYDWVEESVAAMSGFGGDYDASLIYWIKDYDHLDKFLHFSDISKIYQALFADMPMVQQIVREKIKFNID